MAELRKHELQALALLLHAGSDKVGIIDDENKFAAAWVFMKLADRGYCHAIREDGGPRYYLTERGRCALEAAKGEQE